MKWKKGRVLQIREEKKKKKLKKEKIRMRQSNHMSKASFCTNTPAACGNSGLLKEPEKMQ